MDHRAPGPSVRHTFRYLAPGEPRPGDRLHLGDDDAHHCRRVVRRAVGDAVELIDGAGGLWAATVVACDPDAVVVQVGDPRPAPAPAPVRLAVGLLDSGGLDLVVQKGAELGVSDLAVVHTARVRRAPDPAAWVRRKERLERVAAAAARQCGRAQLMRVHGLVPFAAIVADTPAAMGILIDPAGEEPLGRRLARVRPGDGPLTILVGPEAGFDRAEVDGAADAGWTVCGMGDAVLRAETAAIAAATLACAAAGALGGA